MQSEGSKRFIKSLLVIISIVCIVITTCCIYQHVTTVKAFQAKFEAKQEVITRLRNAAANYATEAESHKAKADSLDTIIIGIEEKVNVLDALLKKENEKYNTMLSRVVYLDADSTYRFFTERTNGYK